MFRSVLCVAVVALSTTAGAQQAGSAPRSKADSVAKATADSLAFVREFAKTVSAPAAPARAVGGPQGATNPRMLPDFSAVGDLVGDLSPKGSTQGDGSRLGVREVELAIQSVVDPYFRGDMFLGINDQEKIAIEQAFLTTTSMPWGLQARIGRYLMPVGKQNVTHRHDLHTVEYPYVIQKFMSEDGLKGTGVSVSQVLAPFGFYQELVVSVIDRFGDAVDSLQAPDAVNKNLGGLGYSARLRNYWDLSQASNLELSLSGITGNRQTALGFTTTDGTNAVNARQTLVGADLTYRWKPLQQGLYQSFILQAEWMRQINDQGWLANPDAAGAPLIRNYDGAYVFARWQLAQRVYAGARWDTVQDPTFRGARLTAGSGVLEWFPSEFSKLVASYERRSWVGGIAEDRILLQATFAVGPHKAHPF